MDVLRITRIIKRKLRKCQAEICQQGCSSTAAASFIVRPSDFFGPGWRQVVFAGHDSFAGPGFEFQAGAFGNLAAGLRGGFPRGSTSRDEMRIGT